MLKLINIHKSYKTSNFIQTALDGVSITFRNNEFAAILGPSGSGKTTMLNIIGGLDHYESGDLEIDGISTKKYSDRDWDTYRNNRIGFVFQSYNLIPHQTVLANVELALTLSGVSSSERKERAKEALKEVGLEDHIYKKPNQLSGGQMQRVAIARALINNPEILLADEPTGALDTHTSKQVMELLTNIAKERLVIMVTHNNELAEQYATRIIHLTDGKIISDSQPINESIEKPSLPQKIRKASMSLFTAISLSFSNLMTKKGRTLITALAGSIGIIGIAAILSLANGINVYIANIERDTLSLYPLTIQKSGIDITSLLVDDPDDDTTETTNTKKDSNSVSERGMIQNLFARQKQNDITSLKKYLDDNQQQLDPYINDIQYIYDITPQVFLSDTSKGIEQVNPDSILSDYGMSSSMGSALGFGNFSNMSAFHELPGETDMFEDQYQVLSGHWPKNYDEVVLVLSSDGKVSDYLLYAMGIRDRSQLRSMLESSMNGTAITLDDTANTTYSYDTLMSPNFKVVPSSAYYQYDEEYQIWVDKTNDTEYMKTIIDKGTEVKIVGIVQPDPDATVTTLSSGINYTPELTQHLMTTATEAGIVKDQLSKPDINVLTGTSFVEENTTNQPTFNFMDFITIDENKIIQAFSMDPTKMEIDFSTLDTFSLDPSQMPTMDFDMNAITNSIANQVNIPSAELSAIVGSVITDFIIEEITNGVSDPQQIATDSTAYFARPEVQESINTQLSTVIASSGVESQIQNAMQTYMQTAMQTYATQMGEVIQTQITNQSQQIMQQLMRQMPQQIQNSMNIDLATFEDAFQMNMDEEEIRDLMNTLMNPTTTTYERNLSSFGYADVDTPSQINLYPINFQSKQNIIDMLDTYNANMEKQGASDKVVHYTDIVGTMMTSVTDIVNTISYALIAFVAISLIVSSIMIGVITYISVIERKKEIGILRALGASKRNIRRVFNAETLIIGFVAGILGILVTLLLCIPANIFVLHAFGIERIARLPINGAIILIIVSMCLTFIAGLFPASAAARKDPVEALRSE